MFSQRKRRFFLFFPTECKERVFIVKEAEVAGSRSSGDLIRDAAYGMLPTVPVSFVRPRRFPLNKNIKPSTLVSPGMLLQGFIHSYYRG